MSLDRSSLDILVNGGADTIYNWIGSIVRYKRRYWDDGEKPPFGVVIEVGQASWLVAVWERDQEPSDHVNGMEVTVGGPLASPRFESEFSRVRLPKTS